MERLKQFSLLMCRAHTELNRVVFFTISGGGGEAPRSDTPDRGALASSQAKLDKGQADIQLLDFLHKELEKKVGYNSASEVANKMLVEKDVQKFIDDVAHMGNVDGATLDVNGKLSVSQVGTELQSIDLSAYFGGGSSSRAEASRPAPAGAPAPTPGATRESGATATAGERRADAGTDRPTPSGERSAEPYIERREATTEAARASMARSPDLRPLAETAPKSAEQVRAEQTRQDVMKSDETGNKNRDKDIARADEFKKDLETMSSDIPGRLATSSWGKDVDYYKTYQDIWRSHDGSYEIDQLLAEPPSSGYGRNPFLEQKWDTTNISKLFDSAGSKLTFEDVANELYEPQVPKIQSELKAQGVHEDVTDAMNNDLMDAYADIKEMKKDGKYGDSPDKALAVLEDYISYCSRLVILTGNLRYHAAPKNEPGTGGAESDENAFDNKSPTAEAVRKLFGKENTGAYLVVMNAAREQKIDENGKWNTEINEAKAVAKLNQILELGMISYDGDKEVVQGFTKENLKIISISEITGNTPLDQARSAYLKNGYETYASASEKGNEAEYEALQNSKMKLSPEQAQRITDELRKNGVHDEEKLAQIKKNLTLGVGLMLPTGGNKTGYAVGLEYTFDNDITIGFGFALPEAGFPPDPHAVAFGPTIGYKVAINKDIDISFRLGAAYNTGGGGLESGFGGALGTRITFKGEDVDWYIQAGVGSFGVPGITAGAGVDWRKSNEQYLKTLDKKKVESGVKEIDATGKPYETVKGNPGKYPLLDAVMEPIEKLDLDAASKKAVFEAEYDKFKSKLSKQSLEDTSKAWYESFIPTGAGAGFIFLFGALPIPYVTVNFDIDGSVDVHRIQTSDAKANAITDAQLEEALSKQMAGKTVRVSSTEVRVNGEFSFEDGKMKLAKTREGNLDFSKLMDNNDSFKELRRELSSQCDILVEPDANGRVKIKIDKADGDTKMFIDPRLGDKAILISENGALYLSVAKDANLVTQRKDVVFHDQVNKVGEETTIVIGDGNRPDFKNAIKQSGWYLHRLPGESWTMRKHDEGKGEEVTTQRNLMDSRVGGIGALPADRIEFSDKSGEIKERQDSYDGLMTEISSGEGSSLKAPVISDKVKAAVETLGKNEKLLKAIRGIVTESKSKPEGQLLKDYESLMVLIGNELDKAKVPGTQLFERQYVFAQLFNKTLPKNLNEKEYRSLMNGFEQKLLTELVGNKETVEWIMNQIKDIPVDEKGTPSAIGSSNDMLGGIFVTGRAQWTTSDQHASSESYNIVRKTVIDESNDPNARRMTEFYLAGRRKNFDSGAVDAAVASPKADVAKRINDQMHTGFSLLLMKILPAELTAKEMNDMKALYHSDFKDITADNLPTLQKVMGYINTVMDAERNGKKEVQITPDTKIILDPTVSIGLIQACRNFNGNVQEGFALHNERTNAFMVSGVQTEFLKSETKTYSRTDMGIMLGAALPLPVSHDVGGSTQTDDDAPATGEDAGSLDNPAETTLPSQAANTDTSGGGLN